MVVIPAPVKAVYRESVRRVFETVSDDVDVSKVLSENVLKAQLEKLGVEHAISRAVKCGQRFTSHGAPAMGPQ